MNLLANKTTVQSGLATSSILLIASLCLYYLGSIQLFIESTISLVAQTSKNVGNHLHIVPIY